MNATSVQASVSRLSSAGTADGKRTGMYLQRVLKRLPEPAITLFRLNGWSNNDA